ncbi:MAG: hypothetical protein CMM94_02715 [Rickettsiales bacterium]|nr:hypothetical protein [Rickettsiales bacterium]|tara:strand:+ start:265 stop:942 length:678 start_codon:yes stop_codon:yes gene_type:complete
MGGEIPYGDIIVIGAIAAFILLRYRSILGQKTGHDVSQPKQKSAPLEDNDRIIQLPERQREKEKKDQEEALKLAELDDPDVASAIAQMKMEDAGFSIDEFLQGARMAHDMVITAFSKHDRATLKMLLAEDVYKEFESELEKQEKNNKRHETTLVAVNESEVSEAQLKKSTAIITVRFVSEQIQVVRDESGKVVEGDPSDIIEVEDEWVFERDLRSRNPNWTITDT